MMKLNCENADLFISDALPAEEAHARTSHLGIGAHQDDLEFMALHGILECFQKKEKWFSGITCTDGGGSARVGRYADFSDEEMKKVRCQEQKSAATIGQYSFMAQLGYPSSNVKDPNRRDVVIEDLRKLLAASQPEVVYTHQPADKHETHVGVLLTVLEAIRLLPNDQRPKKVLGCEVWRGLDWVPDSMKIILDVSGQPSLASALRGVFDSQISGGKRYDLAVEGRYRANATFLEAHAVDDMDQSTLAIDLTPLIEEPSLTPQKFIQNYLDALSNEITQTIQKLSLR